LEAPVSEFAWRGWSCDWDATRRGEYELCARATDSAGNVQPVDQNWNLEGVRNNAVQRVRVRVGEAPADQAAADLWLPDSIFELDGDVFVPSEAALSPWSDQSLHGGPPSMLLAREVERVATEQPMLVTRMTVELLRSVGRTPLTVTSRIARPGRKVQIVEA